MTVRNDARFDVTFSSSHHIDTGSFSSGVVIGAGSHPQQIQSVDIDGDGKPDVVELNGYSNTLSVYRNIGSGGGLSGATFAAPVTISVGGVYPASYTTAFAVGDVDNDGMQDIVVVDENGNAIEVLRNTSTPGTVSFAPAVVLGTGPTPDGVALGDLDGDGRLDIIVSVYGYQQISVLKNTGTPGTVSFAGGVNYTTGSGPISVAVGDLDGDGRPDVVVGTLLQGISVFRNTSVRGTIDGNTLAPRIDLNPTGGGYMIALADMDGDGKPDILQLTSVVSVYRNTRARWARYRLRGTSTCRRDHRCLGWRREIWTGTGNRISR
jgi:hypothetical protein